MELTVTNNVSENLNPWPYADVLDEMMGADFAGLISTLQVDVVIAGRIDAGLGNSKSLLSVYGEMNRGDEGIEDLKIMAKAFADGIRSSISQMSGDYKKLYEEALADFDKNGLEMPIVGRLI